MNLEVLNPNTLSFNEIMSNVNNLYYVAENNSTKTFNLLPVSKHGMFNLKNKDFLIVKITGGETADDIPEEMVEVKVPAIEEMRHKRTRVANRTYKLNSSNRDETIFVEYRPGTGSIRVNFLDKESAQTYFEYFRDQFYTSTTGASVITVSNIYKDLNLVNWKPEDCDDWGWYTQDYGPCRKISEVLKTKNTKMYGFTLKCPEKLYESKKREEAN